MIRVERLVKRFGLEQALRGIDLGIDEGEIVALLGPNGAGKTTLLRILATLSRPTSGTVTIAGHPLSGDWVALRRHIGFVSHQSLLYPELTGEENLRLFARLYGVDPEGHRLGQVGEWVGLSRRLRDPVRGYSRGMVQRLALARALLHDPQLLLLDEPFSGLDEAAAERLLELLARIHAEEPARVTLLATHDLARALTLSRRVVLLRRGRVALDAPRGAEGVESWRARYLATVA